MSEAELEETAAAPQAEGTPGADPEQASAPEAAAPEPAEPTEAENYAAAVAEGRVVEYLEELFKAKGIGPVLVHALHGDKKARERVALEALTVKDYKAVKRRWRKRNVLRGDIARFEDRDDMSVSVGRGALKRLNFVSYKYKPKPKNVALILIRQVGDADAQQSGFLLAGPPIIKGIDMPEHETLFVLDNDKQRWAAVFRHKQDPQFVDFEG